MTDDQSAAFARFRSLLGSLRLRVLADPEGWPIVPGRHGQLEWHDEHTVAIYSAKMRMLARLAQLPGLRRHQIGDHEFRLLLDASGMHDSGALGGVIRVLRLRTRRVLSDAHKVALGRGRRFQRQEAP